jgi:hypothetical protein
VEAIYLWLEAKAATKAFEYPPMLRSSWNILVNRSRTNQELVTAGSYALQISDRLWGSGCWLVWREPDATTRAVTSADPATDWDKLSAWILTKMGEGAPQDLVRDVAAKKQLTPLELTILRYFVEVIHAQRMGQNLAAKLDRAGLLGPITALYRKFKPSDLSLQLQKTAALFLSRDKIVTNLGLPLGAVDEAIAGLIVKLDTAQPNLAAPDLGKGPMAAI